MIALQSAVCFRALLVDGLASQTKSLTQSIAYLMAGAHILYTLTVVDTSGFRHTQLSDS